MPGIHDTAYPRLKGSVSAQELAAAYTPTADEVALAHQVAQDTRNRICFLVLLKTFQRLGYFELLHVTNLRRIGSWRVARISIVAVLLFYG